MSMFRLRARGPRFLLMLCLAWWCAVAWTPRALAQDFLPPEKAFRFSAQAVAPDTVEFSWKIAPGYYMYREQFAFTAHAEGVELGDAQLPPGKIKFDETFAKDVETYRDTVVARLSIPTGVAFDMTVRSQGCADAGLCYPPAEHPVGIQPASLPGGLPAVTGGQAQGLDWSALAGSDDVGLADMLAGSSLAKTALVFLGLGLLLSLTPCVLPMVPILSALVVGDTAGRARPRLRGLALAGAYVFGMSVVYTAAGLLAGLSGVSLAASLQTPWVLGLFATLLVLLALAMFDVFTLQLPANWQSSLSARAAALPGGRMTGSLAMGAVSALIVGPCVAAPLAGALLYVSQTRDVVLGGVALFALAWGMGVPLLAAGASAGALLPRNGAWMTWVKRFFGVLLLAVAAWMVWPVLPWPGTSVETPAGAPRAPLSTPGSAIAFERVRSVAELDALLAASDKPVMLDFYADWCVSCKEMEAFTFPRPEVASRLGQLRLVQADVTANNADDKALLARFKLFGPPGIVFFAPGGAPLPQRVIGYQNAERFARTLDAVLAGGS